MRARIRATLSCLTMQRQCLVSNVHAAVEWAAGQTRTRLDETLNFEDDDSEDE
jgi:hypothetical protein